MTMTVVRIVIIFFMYADIKIDMESYEVYLIKCEVYSILISLYIIIWLITIVYEIIMVLIELINIYNGKKKL